MPTTAPSRSGYYQEHSRESIKKMWRVCMDEIKGKDIEKIIILDEGGRCLETMPEFLRFNYQVAGIEQTSAGLNSDTFSQCIFGCTGIDVTQGLNILDIVKEDKTFISCTSEDKEFLSLLRTISDKSIVFFNPLTDIKCRTNSGSILTILRGGFPVNFDNTPESVPGNDIQLTRGLLLGACLQAIFCAQKPVGDGITINLPTRQKLNAYVQRFVVEHWILQQPKNRYNTELIANFSDIEWISKNSGGLEHKNEFFYRCYSQEQALQANLSISKAKL